MTQLRIEPEMVEDANHSDNPHFNELLQARLSRRKVLGGGVGMTAAMMFGGLSLAGCSSDDDTETSVTPTPTPQPVTPALPTSLSFTPVAKNLNDVVTVPADYNIDVLYALGTPFVSGLNDWSDDGMQSGESFTLRSGDCHDGMNFFGLSDAGNFDAARSDRGLLCMNHEYINATFLHPNGPTTVDGRRPVSEVRREVNAHGISVIEVKRNTANSSMMLVKDSMYNRRVTSLTTMDMTGPVAGSTLLATRFSPNGKQTRGTNNNCANGYTPWGTYLTCEENFVGAFARAATDDLKRTPAEIIALNRYSLTAGYASRYGWQTVPATDAIVVDEFERWNSSVTADTAAQDYRNGINTFGWIVEVDPFKPMSNPVKRTALGRFAHECCWPAPAVVGQPVVFYMGDDARGEYMYKFVSKNLWEAADVNGGINAGAKYMDEGTLYVAKFNADGMGTWIELSFGKNGLNNSNAVYPFSDQADVLTFARLAGDAVGATKMDRPEWTSVSPVTGEVYLTLTNNSKRTIDAVDAANPRSYEDVYTKTDGTTSTNKGNVNGHIIRWKEQGGLHNATVFQWDVYLFGAEADAAENINLSGLSDANDFSSPDGLWFDPRGMLWIQTDDGAYTDETNCMMLAALPGQVGDGGKKQVGAVETYIGKKPTQSSLSRFLVGPVECEITGIAMTPDCKTLFVNIQHPGEDGSLTKITSHWPASQTNAAAISRPRSGTVMVTRKDGGVILG